VPQTCGRGLSVLGGGKLLAGALVLTVIVEAFDGPPSSVTFSMYFKIARERQGPPGNWRWSVAHTGFLARGNGAASGRG